MPQTTSYLIKQEKLLKILEFTKFLNLTRPVHKCDYFSSATPTLTKLNIITDFVTEYFLDKQIKTPEYIDSELNDYLKSNFEFELSTFSDKELKGNELDDILSRYNNESKIIHQTFQSSSRKQELSVLINSLEDSISNIKDAFNFVLKNNEDFTGAQSTNNNTFSTANANYKRLTNNLDKTENMNRLDKSRTSGIANNRSKRSSANYNNTSDNLDIKIGNIIKQDSSISKNIDQSNQRGSVLNNFFCNNSTNNNSSKNKSLNLIPQSKVSNLITRELAFNKYNNNHCFIKTNPHYYNNNKTKEIIETLEFKDNHNINKSGELALTGSRFYSFKNLLNKENKGKSSLLEEASGSKIHKNETIASNSEHLFDPFSDEYLIKPGEVFYFYTKNRNELEIRDNKKYIIEGKKIIGNINYNNIQFSRLNNDETAVSNLNNKDDDVNINSDLNSYLEISHISDLNNNNLNNKKELKAELAINLSAIDRPKINRRRNNNTHYNNQFKVSKNINNINYRSNNKKKQLVICRSEVFDFDEEAHYIGNEVLFKGNIEDLLLCKENQVLKLKSADARSLAVMLIEIIKNKQQLHELSSELNRKNELLNKCAHYVHQIQNSFDGKKVEIDFTGVFGIPNPISYSVIELPFDKNPDSYTKRGFIANKYINNLDTSNNNKNSNSENNSPNPKINSSNEIRRDFSNANNTNTINVITKLQIDSDAENNNNDTILNNIGNKDKPYNKSSSHYNRSKHDFNLKSNRNNLATTQNAFLTRNNNRQLSSKSKDEKRSFANNTITNVLKKINKFNITK